jgi:hypothetical protein
MKRNPDFPGGSLKSMPTWSNALGCSATSAFFVLGDPSPGFATSKRQDTYVAKPTAVSLADRKSLRKPREGLKQRVADY